MENFIKEPEKKINSATKLLNDISSKLNRRTTELSKQLSKVRNLEKGSDTLLFNILDLQQDQIQKSQKVQPQQSLAPSETSPSTTEEKPDSSFGAAVSAAMGAGALSQLTQTGEDGRTTPMVSEGGVSPDSYIFSGYGMREGGMHRGIDISGGPFQNGAPFSVIQSGVVEETGNLGNVGWGKYVVIKHDNGLYSLYGHMQNINVKRGDPIGKNGESTVIGTIGSTGKSTGPHIHFELGKGWNGTIVDSFNPAPYVKNYIRGGGKVKIRPQNSQSSVNPKLQNQASTNQLQPVAINKSNTNLLASQQVLNSVPMNTELQSTSTSVSMESEKQSEKLLYQLALAVKTK